MNVRCYEFTSSSLYSSPKFVAHTSSLVHLSKRGRLLFAFHQPREGPLSRSRIPLSRQDENARLMKERLEMSTAEIGLSVRTTNCLEERGIFTVRDLLNSTPDQLLSIANFGEKTLEEVYKALEKFGFYRSSRQKAMAI